MKLVVGKTINPGVDEVVALEQAKSTISDIMDAIVELVTNCNDSYLSLENSGTEVSGIIDIHVERQKGGKLLELKILDEAAGMTPEKIADIICYARKTSMFYSGINVRGFFGRGLKESIIALGNGEIISVSDGNKTHGKYYWDYKDNKPKWLTISIDKTNEQSGTTIIITARDNEVIDCPTFDTLKNRIENHYALRDILTVNRRKIRLHMKQTGLKKGTSNKSGVIKYDPPQGQQIEDKKLYLKGFGVAVFKLFESSERLPYSRNDPYSQAGIMVKTTNATLDNQLFGFDNDPNAHFFFGEVRCKGIAEKIRDKKQILIVRTDRTGLNWRNPYCKEVESEIKKILDKHITRKRKQNEAKITKSTMPEERVAKIKRLVRKLNKLGRELLGEHGSGPDILQDPNTEITKLTIYPSEAIAPTNEYRTFSVYNVFNQKNKQNIVHISLDEPKGKFDISDNKVKLKTHKKRNDLLIGYFKIKGFKKSDKTGIIASQAKEDDIAEFIVGSELVKKDKGKNPRKEKKGGLFTDLIFDNIDKQPLQRVYYNRHNGEIRIYIHYPGVNRFLGENGNGSETSYGSMLLSELIAEAFCKETARRKVEREYFSPEGQLDKYLQIYNEHLKTCIPILHSILLG